MNASSYIGPHSNLSRCKNSHSGKRLDSCANPAHSSIERSRAAREGTPHPDRALT
jgi:hypothetical protein